MSTRDYVGEMRALVDKETARGPYGPGIAKEIADTLTANDLDLLSGYLLAQAPQIIWQMIIDRDRSKRAHARTADPRSAFAAAAAEHERGNPAPLREWLDCAYAVEDGSRRTLATLTKDDLCFVATGYEDRSKANAFEAVFFRAIAKRCPTGTVADHFSEEQIAELRRRLSS